MAKLIYVQSTGEFFDDDSPKLSPIMRGCSGYGDHKNWPASQFLSNVGPIPRGFYKIGAAETIEDLTCAIRLSPESDNDMCGRTGFLIHGDNQKAPSWVSEGSIVVDGEDNRKTLSTFDQLQVIDARPITLAGLSEMRSFRSRGDSYLGWGYRSYATSLSTAPVFNTSAYSLPPQESYNVVDFGVVASKEHFEEAFSVDASISGAGTTFSGTAKARLTEKYSRDVTSVTIALTKRVMAGRYRLNVSKFPLDKLAADTAQKDPTDYIASYGDQVVSAVGMGGACCYFFKYNFKSETEASAFAGSIGATYGAFSGSISAARSKLLQQTNVSISLAGYSTGTLDVPQVIMKNSHVRDRANFLFEPDFGDDIVRNLFDFFDSFQNHFSGDYAKNPSQFPQYSQVEMVYSSLHQIPGGLLPNKEQLTKLGDKATEIAVELDGEDDLALQSQSELKYMIARLTDYNTRAALRTANSFIKAVDKLCGKNGKIRKRRLALDRGLDVKSKYKFYDEVPKLHRSFCTVDPEVRPTRYYRLKGDPKNVTLYTFDINEDDFGRTCRIEARGVLRQYKAYDTTHARIELVKKKKGGKVPALRKVKIAADDAGWEVVEFIEQSCGHNDGYYLNLKPRIFIPSEDEMYAVRAYAGPVQIYQQELTLSTWLSLRREDKPLY